MITSSQTKEQYVAERMERFRMTAQCQCAAHYIKAQQQAVADWEGSKKLEEWFQTPEGISAKAEFQKNMQALLQELNRKP